MFKKLLTIIFMVLLSSQIALAQTQNVAGVVTDSESGEPLAAVTVQIEGGNVGVTTDMDGEYTIQASPNDVLLFSFIGYERQRVPIDGRVTINVELSPDIALLNEVVVTGYGTETKREITGSISSVRTSDFENIPVTNTESILQGRAAGVRAAATSGTPGAGLSVQIRGQGSINAGSQPLYVVDGVQISFTNQNGRNDNTPLNAIPPENIASIEVLKDAAAASIYGAQAGNGVVLITTKRGQAGAPQVRVSVSRGATSMIRNNDYFNRDQWIEYQQAAIQYDNPGASPEVVENFFNSSFLPAYGFAPDTPYDELPNTDWFDYNSRTGVSETYRATVSGGTQSSTYRISAGYEDTEGYIRENTFQNYNISGNFDQQLSSKLSSQININLSSQSFNGPCQDGFFTNCPISQAAFSAPIARPFLDDGSFSPFGFFGSQNNPAIQLSDNRRSETSVLQILGSISAKYDFYEWLSLNTRLGLDFREENEREYRSAIANPADNGSLLRITAPTTNIITSTTLNFDRAIDETSSVSGLVGFEYRRDYTEQFSASGIGFPNPLFNVLNTTATATGAAGFNSEFRQAGYFTQLKYNYDNRYRASFTARYDGSSRFGAEKRFGFFPSGSVAWTISEESFFNFDPISDLKLRVGYGVTGNSNIGRFAARGLFGTQGSYQGRTALRPTQLANDELSWERSVTTNLGLDYELFDGRISGSFDVYRRNTTDLLLGQPLPIDSGFGSITRNIGEVQNQGLEITVNSVNVNTRGFRWSTRFNISFNENEVISLSENEDALNPASIQPVEVGRSIDAWRVIRYAGVNPADGRPIYFDADGELTYRPDFDDDAKFFGGAEEDSYGGIGNTFSYKGLSLRTFFQFGIGQLALPQQVVAFGINQVGGSGTNGLDKRLTEAWRQPGDIKPFPAPTRSFFYPESIGYFVTTNEKLYKTDYIRLKDVTLSYNLPSSVTQRAGIGNVNVYISGLNLATWTSYIGFDPEVAGDATAASIPVGRTIRGGIEINF